METITDSDYRMVQIQLDSSRIIEKNKQRNKKRQKETRRLYLYHKATEENWNDYRHEVEKIIRNATKRKKKNRHKAEEEPKPDINEEWELIAKAIQAAASKHIPSTKTQDSNNQVRKEATKSFTYSRAKVLVRIYRKGSKALGQNIDNLERVILDAQIEHLNIEYEIKILLLPEFWNRQYCNEVKEWQNILKGKVRKELQAEKE